MSDRGHQLLYRTAHAAARHAGAIPDTDLVRRLANANDRAAFELLLWRHGPAVWGVCRRVLGSTPDAEDAFQAVFLALARRAGAIADGRALPAWLHGARRNSYPAGVRTVAACSLYSHKAGDRPPPMLAKPSGVPSCRSTCSFSATRPIPDPGRLPRKCKPWGANGTPGCRSSARR